MRYMKFETEAEKQLAARLYDLSRYCGALKRDLAKHERREAALRFIINPPEWEIYDPDLTEVQKFLKGFVPTDNPPPPGLIFEETLMDKPDYFGPLALNDQELAKNISFFQAQFNNSRRLPTPGDLVTATFNGRDYGRFTIAPDGRTLIPAADPVVYNEPPNGYIQNLKTGSIRPLSPDCKVSYYEVGPELPKTYEGRIEIERPEENHER